jgi:hypothetical protein
MSVEVKNALTALGIWLVGQALASFAYVGMVAAGLSPLVSLAIFCLITIGIVVFIWRKYDIDPAAGCAGALVIYIDYLILTWVLALCGMAL